MTEAFSDRAALAARIHHAQSYPFARPACSYLFEGGAMRPLRKDVTERRAPVIASGSNAAPDRLAAKFGDQATIPVIRARLSGFVVVFAGHLTAYGAMPATLHPHPGASTTVWITWLTSDQLSLMHRSEGVIACREVEQRYDFAGLKGLDLHPEIGPPIAEAGAYLSRRLFAPEGSPIRFAEVASGGAGMHAASHPSILRKAAGLLDPDAGLNGFMARVLSGVAARQALFRELSPYTIERDEAWPDARAAIRPITP